MESCPTHCKYCLSQLPTGAIIHRTVVCRECGGSYRLEPPRKRVWAPLLGALAAAVVLAWSWHREQPPPAPPATPAEDGSLLAKIAAHLTGAGRSLRLTTLDGIHFGVPISFQKGGEPEVFLVDTGATVVTMPTADVEKHFSDLSAAAESGIGRLANGELIELKFISIPVVFIGQWEIRDVRVSYCDRCQRLAGLSLFQEMRVEVANNGGTRTLTISR